MGTCSSIYIEFKKRSDKQWHLLEAVVQLDYRDRSFNEEEPDGNHIVEVGGAHKAWVTSVCPIEKEERVT